MTHRLLAILFLTSATLYAAPGNRVLLLSGIGDEVAIPGAGSLKITSGQLTMEAWVRCQQPPQDGAILVKGIMGWDYGMGFPGTTRQFAYDQLTGYYGVTNASSRLTPWNHYAITIDDTKHEFCFYINGKRQTDIGVVEGTPDLSKMIRSSSEAMYLGRGGLVGAMDEVRVWNAVRTPEQIQGGMYTSLSGTEPNLVGYWNFDDGTARDCSMNHNDGTLLVNATTGEEPVPCAMLPRTYGGYVGFALVGLPGEKYGVEYSTAPAAGPWTVLTNVTLLSTTFEFIDYDSATQARRFYRAVRAEP